jgi:hypothetical protein
VEKNSKWGRLRSYRVTSYDPVPTKPAGISLSSPSEMRLSEKAGGTPTPYQVEEKTKNKGEGIRQI